MWASIWAHSNIPITCSLSFSPWILFVFILASAFGAFTWGRQWLKLGKLLLGDHLRCRIHHWLLQGASWCRHSREPPTQSNIPAISIPVSTQGRRTQMHSGINLGPVAIFHLNGSCIWTLGLQRVDPSTFLCATFCPSKPTWTWAPLLPRWSPTIHPHPPPTHCLPYITILLPCA